MAPGRSQGVSQAPPTVKSTKKSAKMEATCHKNHVFSRLEWRPNVRTRVCFRLARLGGKTYGGCLPDASQMPSRCLPGLPDVSQVSQMPPRCLPDVSQMPPRCLSDVSQMSLRHPIPQYKNLFGVSRWGHFECSASVYTTARTSTAATLRLILTSEPRFRQSASMERFSL